MSNFANDRGRRRVPPPPSPPRVLQGTIQHVSRIRDRISTYCVAAVFTRVHRYHNILDSRFTNPRVPLPLPSYHCGPLETSCLQCSPDDYYSRGIRCNAILSAPTTVEGYRARSGYRGGKVLCWNHLHPSFRTFATRTAITGGAELYEAPP